jgi:hypothetical protein
MDIFDDELLNFWRQLRLAGVKFIMVGGVATNLHGYNRTTDDIDVWIDDTVENRKNFRTAFKQYSDLDLFMMEKMQIVPGWTPFNLNNGIRLDLMTNMKGLEGFSFEDCHKQASIATIDDVEVPFLHINHLLANKKAVNRPKDQLDVIYLEKLRQMQEKEQSGE